MIRQANNNEIAEIIEHGLTGEHANFPLIKNIYEY